MPVGSPGTLRPQEYADLVALIFELNKFPAGSQELPAARDQLELITIGKVVDESEDDDRVRVMRSHRPIVEHSEILQPTCAGRTPGAGRANLDASIVAPGWTSVSSTVICM